MAFLLRLAENLKLIQAGPEHESFTWLCHFSLPFDLRSNIWVGLQMVAINTPTSGDFPSFGRNWYQVNLQQYGCQYLCSMAQAPDVREEILKHGGIPPLIAAMNNYPQDGTPSRKMPKAQPSKLSWFVILSPTTLWFSAFLKDILLVSLLANA